MANHIDLLNQSVQYLKAVGPKKIKLLQKLKIFTVKDLIYYFPRRYEDRSCFQPINKALQGTFQTIKGRVLTSGTRRLNRGRTIFQLAIGDSTGVIYGTWFNQPYLKKIFRVNDEVILYGKIERYGNLQISSPEYEILSKDFEDTIHTGRIVPIYPLTNNISQRYLRMIIKYCLDEHLGSVVEFLPEEIILKHKFLPLIAGILNIHFPDNFKMLSRAKQRLIFDEFFLLQTALGLKRQKIKTQTNGIKYRIRGDLLLNFKKLLPFQLTKSQKNVIEEIEQDMHCDQPMNRLLQGDVGSGKTVVSLWALLICVQNGFQAALMVPTEILAQQHYQTIQTFTASLGVRIGILKSSLKKAEKEKILFEIKEHQIDIIIGTHSLIQKNICFKKLGLVIVDEQHKFGVLQRANLQQKGCCCDVLVMTATPIPRTLAITVYGAMDVSTINEMPPGRIPVKTYWITEKKRQDMYDFLTRKMKNKNQVYVVYPLVEESEVMDLKAATKMYEHFKDVIFRNFKIGLLHGKMKSVDKKLIMESFKKGNLDMLVSTVVIEVGIDVSNASIMLIEHAERFGLSQLHQLRGRVGRGGEQAYCILLCEGKTQDAVKRLNAMVKTNDGFKIAEYDLLIRGPGEFFGSKQHGLPELKIGNILADAKLLRSARKESFAYLQNRSLVHANTQQLISLELKNRFGQNKDLFLVR
ncbi:MAG: DNA helicase RecG [Candidatus Omnitrophota bacterium]|nr:MAG: DNA helicase RecG [Candidatus Omnitrophota bacterium]